MLNGNLKYRHLNISTAYSDITIIVEKAGNILRLHFRGPLKIAIESGATVTLCTLSEPFRPAIQLCKELILRYNHNLYASITVAETGEIKLLAYQAIPAGITLFIDETFITNKL